MKFYSWFFETIWKVCISSIYIWVGTLIAYLPSRLFTNIPKSYINYLLLLIILVIMTYGRVLMILAVNDVYQGESPKGITIINQVVRKLPKAVIFTICIFVLLIGLVELISSNKSDFINSIMSSFLPVGDIRLLAYLLIIIFVLMIFTFYEFVLVGMVISNYKFTESLFKALYNMIEARNTVISVLGLIAVIYSLYVLCLVIIFPAPVISFLVLYFIYTLIEVGIIVLYLKVNEVSLII